MNQLAQLKKVNTKHKQIIVGLQTGATTTTSEDVNMEDAGDEFGGKSKKSKNKWLKGLYILMLIIVLKVVYFMHYIIGQTNINFICNISVFSSQKRRTFLLNVITII